MSDASAEAERLISALRARGYQVVDVPLGLLVSRVSVQRPALILCDADASGAMDTVERVHRDIPGGHRVDVLFVREQGGGSTNELTSFIEREGSGSFVRPVDDATLTRKVEALIGPPTRHEPRPRLAAGGRAPILVAAARRPLLNDTRSVPSHLPQPPSQPPRSTALGALPSSAPNPPSNPLGSPLSTPEPSSWRRDEPVVPGAAQFAQARLSPELELLLGRAEQRAAQGRASIAPPSDRLSPEAELDAILPNDVLAALDEPLDLDDSDDSDAGSSTAGGDERGTTQGTGNTGAKHTENTSSKALGLLANAAEATSTPAHGTERPGTERPSSPESEPPKTPPAIPGRSSRTNPGGSERGGSEPAPQSNLAEPRVADDGAGHSEVPAPESAPPPSEWATQQPSTTPPKAGAVTALDTAQQAAYGPSAGAAQVVAPAQALQLPSTLRAGDAIRCLALAVGSRYTGAVAFEAPDGVRRVVFRDGDFVTAATGVDSESLVACLSERGSLPADASSKLGRKLPLFGRHAGAALIAHGYLQQDELWPVLRSHAEWLIGRIAQLERGETGVEPEVPPRLASEPAVFGGATGAEVLVDLVRRVSTPEASVARLGGPHVRLRPGPRHGLLGECALSMAEAELLRSLDGEAVNLVLERAASKDFSSVLLALVELGILEKAGIDAQAGQATPAKVATRALPDRLDHQALRSRIAARRALVDEGDYFAVLGVSRNATGYDVHRAYTELREELNPTRVVTAATADLRDDVDAILFIVEEAYQILSDDLRRERYRRALEASPR